MKWLLTELMTRRGTRIKTLKVLNTPVTLESDGSILYAFDSERLLAEITLHEVKFHRDGIIVKGLCRFGERVYYYQEWWLRPEPVKEGDA